MFPPLSNLITLTFRSKAEIYQTRGGGTRKSLANLFDDANRLLLSKKVLTKIKGGSPGLVVKEED